MDSNLIKSYESFGKDWVKGKAKVEEIEMNGKKFILNKKQKEFINSTKKFCLCSGGFGSGKTASLLIKMILQSLCFPKNRILLGRRYISDLERATLPELFELLNPKWYKYRVKDGIIHFANDSEIILFGLDSLQTGSQSDIKKAQQKLKSLNLGGYYIDQLEEVDEAVFNSLNSRMRRMTVPLRQGNMTCNPANFWAYSFFKVNSEERKDVHLIESSMLDNKDHLPEDYIQEQLSHDENYVKRFVYGYWDKELMTANSVFASEYIHRWKPIKPLKIEEGCEIYEDYDSSLKYQMGVDPSEGSVDPSSISVVSGEGHKVAKFNGKIPIHALGEKVKFLYYKYGKPLIIPEVNASGQALLLQIRDLRIFERKVYDEKVDKETRKLGWKTSFQSKQSLISFFQELLRMDFPKIYDQKTINEFMTFVWSDAARQRGAGAEPNYHDDDVISTLLAFWQLSPKILERIKKRREKPRRIKKPQYI